MGYMTRQPTGNDQSPKTDKNRWLNEGDEDMFALLVNGFVKYCKGCRRPVRIHHLDNKQRCPDCHIEEKKE